ncbi:predicted protein [Postia placenta Mad-698-R]|nr:predicted protein [Postia placenta Mad-698-R]
MTYSHIEDPGKDRSVAEARTSIYVIVKGVTRCEENFRHYDIRGREDTDRTALMQEPVELPSSTERRATRSGRAAKRSRPLDEQRDGPGHWTWGPRPSVLIAEAAANCNLPDLSDRAICRRATGIYSDAWRRRGGPVPHIVAGSGSTTPATSERTAAFGDLHAVDHAACPLPLERAGRPKLDYTLGQGGTDSQRRRQQIRDRLPNENREVGTCCNDPRPPLLLIMRSD